jgi:hypothetical protein
MLNEAIFMDEAPNGPPRSSGQSGRGATDNQRKPAIGIFGERHTATRAIISMIGGLDDVRARLAAPADKAARPIIKLLKAAVEVHQSLDGGNDVQTVLNDVMSLAKPRAAAWKHARLEWDESFMALSGVILTCRNPYSWLLAMFSRPYHHIGRRIDDLSTFITTPWLTIPRERMEAAVASPAALWSAKQAAALQFSERAKIPTRSLPIEVFLADPVASLGAVLEGFGHSSEGLAAIETNTKSNEPLAKLQKRHKVDPWRDWLTAAQVANFNAHLDAEVVQASGYSIEKASDYPDRLTAKHAESLANYVNTRRNQP